MARSWTDAEWIAATRDFTFGTAVAGGWSYTFGWRDYADACRAVVGETTGWDRFGREWSSMGTLDKLSRLLDARAILHTMLNRLYLLHDKPIQERNGPLHLPPHPYSRILRVYCQPLIAAWATPTLESDPDKIARRIDVQNLGPAAVPAEVRTLVARFMVGQTAARPWRGLVHFAACQEQFVERHGEPAVRLRDCFWRARDGNPMAVVRPPPTITTLAQATPGLLAFGGAVAVAVLLG